MLEWSWSVWLWKGITYEGKVPGEEEGDEETKERQIKLRGDRRYALSTHTNSDVSAGELMFHKLHPVTYKLHRFSINATFSIFFSPFFFNRRHKVEQFFVLGWGLRELRLFEAGRYIHQLNVLRPCQFDRQRDKAASNKLRQASVKGDEAANKSDHKFSSLHTEERNRRKNKAMI